jgi:hypothetical protein
MNRFLNRTLVITLLAISLAAITSAQTSDNNKPLTNAEVLRLVHAGFKEKTIISIVASRPPAFDLSTEQMIELKRRGVSEKIILAMLSRQQGLAIDDETWSNDDAFNRQNSDKSKDSQKSSGGNQADIFGSSGSGQSSIKTRGGTLSQSGDTETMGSATVRIIRPPSETTNAPVKLERTPSLTNDSIIELVEAGFSEGTIVRRIEQSPVDFDLSASKIADLRKHQVGEKILAAMKAAMGGDSNPSRTRTTSNGTPKPQ